MQIFIDRPKFQTEKKTTPYPIERDCAHFMIDNKEYRRWILVHGFIARNGKLKRTAWLERAGKVITIRTVRSKLMPATYDKNTFYKKNKPTGTNLYRYKEVLLNMRRYRRYGRWEAL